MNGANDRDLACWAEYDAVADWCASQGFTGGLGTALPDHVSVDVADLIDDDPHAFRTRVREHAYARAMAPIDAREGASL